MPKSAEELQFEVLLDKLWSEVQNAVPRLYYRCKGALRVLILNSESIDEHEDRVLKDDKVEPLNKIFTVICCGIERFTTRMDDTKLWQEEGKKAMEEFLTQLQKSSERLEVYLSDLRTNVKDMVTKVITCINPLVEKIKRILSILGLKTKETPAQPPEPEKETIRLSKKSRVNGVRERHEERKRNGIGQKFSDKI